MTARLLFILVFFIYTGGVYSQTAASDNFKVQKAAAKSSAQKMAQLLIEKKYAEFSKYMHPDITKLSGGSAGMADILQKTMQQMETGGVIIKSVKVEDPITMIKVGSQFQGVVPEVLEMNVNSGDKKGILTQRSHLIAISDNAGKSWSFVDAGNKTIEQIRQILPFLSTKITIPTKEPPVFNAN